MFAVNPPYRCCADGTANIRGRVGHRHFLWKRTWVLLRFVFLHNSVNALLSSCSAVLSHPTRHHSCGASRDYLLPALRIPHFVQHSWESSSLRHSFGELKFPSSQAVLRYRTAIATFLKWTSRNWGSFFISACKNIYKFILFFHEMLVSLQTKMSGM